MSLTNSLGKRAINWYPYLLYPDFSLRWSNLGHQSEWKLLSCVWLFRTPWTIQSMDFSRPEYWGGWPFPSPEDLSNRGIKPRSPALQVENLPAEPQGKPKNTGVGTLSLFQWIFLTQELNQALLNRRQILYQLSYQWSRMFNIEFVYYFEKYRAFQTFWRLLTEKYLYKH